MSPTSKRAFLVICAILVIILLFCRYILPLKAKKRRYYGLLPRIEYTIWQMASFPRRRSNIYPLSSLIWHASAFTSGALTGLDLELNARIPSV